MKKRLMAFLLIAIFCLSFGIMVCATEEKSSRLVDFADILTEPEESRLLAILDEISERQQLDIVVVTTNTLDGKSPMVYADDFYDEDECVMWGDAGIGNFFMNHEDLKNNNFSDILYNWDCC